MSESYELEALAKAAQAGDADAQYRLASLLVQSGDEAERGIEWLRKAAAAGHANARYTLALFTLKGLHVDAKPARAVSLLETIALKSHPPARMLLAVLMAAGVGVQAPDYESALELTIKAAELGDPGAARDMGLLGLFSGVADETVHAWLFCAATRGDLMAAALLIARYGDGDQRLDAATIKYWAKTLADAGHPLAYVWNKAIDAAPLERPPVPADIPSLKGADLTKLDTLLERDTTLIERMERPRVSMVINFIPRAMAAHLIGFAAPYLKQEGGLHRAVLGYSEMDLSMAVLSMLTAKVAGHRMTVDPLIIEAIPPGQAGPALSPETGEHVVASSFLTLSDVSDGGGLAFGGGGTVERADPGTLHILQHRLDDGAIDREAFVEHVASTRVPRWQLMQLMLPK